MPIDSFIPRFHPLDFLVTAFWKPNCCGNDWFPPWDATDFNSKHQLLIKKRQHSRLHPVPYQTSVITVA